MRKRQREQRRSGGNPSVVRAATDELGITTPKTARKRRRKRALRVKVLEGRRV